jgi:hypothetical protein
LLKLFLDEHLAPALAGHLRKHRPERETVALQEYQGGALRGIADDVILSIIAAEQWTLVTYDLRTIPIVLNQWAAEGRSHGGVIFIDQRTIPPNDIGGLVRSLCQLSDTQGELDWIDRVIFLSR